MKMDITYGELAGLIAAGAFLIFVLFLIPVLLKVAKTMKEVSGVVSTANSTIATVTDDVSALSEQVEGLLVKTNTLLNDVNGKVATIDPVFVAAADLGQSVSDVNNSTKNIVSRVSDLSGKTSKAGMAASILSKLHSKKKSED